jgi:ABC-type lipoprotein export system ATPase subunit
MLLPVSSAAVPPTFADLVVRAEGVRKSYDGREILHGVGLRLAAGERVALMGPSGSGKTTLLNCLGGVDRIDGGEIELCGEALHRLDRAGLAAVRRRWLGTIFQFFHLLPTLSAAENIEFPLQLLGVARRERAARVGELLERVGLAHRAHALPGQLSGGEMQRTAIARALAHRPPVLLADEPTGNLDSASGARILELLRELSEETRTALLLVTHSAEAAAICHRVLHLRDGAVVAEDARA